MWGDPEQRHERKIFRIGRGAAFCLGGGLALWGLALFYPHPEGSEKITAALWPTGTLFIVYGITILTTIVMKQELTRTINFLFMGVIIPACLFYIFVNNWHG